MPKTATSVNVKPKIVIQRVSQSQADYSRISLRDIFYKVENNLGEELRLRTSPTNQKMRHQQNQVVEEAEELASGSDMDAAEY
jgi:protease II